MGTASDDRTFYTGGLLLCYKFNYRAEAGGSADGEPTPFLLFADVRAVVVRYDRVVPNGTAIGCSSDLTITGAGFATLALAPEVVARSPYDLRMTSV